MTSIATENLEERIERIRKRTEEIEKKHRAAEEDRLMALMDNAMVKTKPPKDEDWPKAHKYDKLDFTYDIKPEKLEENSEQKQLLIKPKRDYKKFADGKGPPPDPIYNFLADAERDGIILQQKEQQQQHQQHKNNDKKELKQNQLNNSFNNGRNIDNNNKNKDQFNKRGGGNGQQINNNSFRNRGNGNGNNNINNGKPQQNNRYQKQNSQSENQKQNVQPEQWRSEKIDDNNKTNNRQKINNGGGSNSEKWRRGDWDNNDMKTDKNNSNDLHNNKSPKHNNNTTNKNYYQHHHSNQQQQSPQNYHQQNTTPIENIIEKRGNIMVSVSPGEVKSVKLTSAQVIGSGRVGPRQLSKPQFHIQTMEKEQQQIIQKTNVPGSPRPQINSGYQQLNKLNNFNNQQQQNHNNYQQHATKNSIPPTHRQQQTTTSQQLNLNTNNGLPLAPKSPIKEKRNTKSSKYNSPQQQKPILPNLISVVSGGVSAGDNILTSPSIANQITVNNMVNSLLNTTAANTNTANSGTISNVDITGPEIDVKVLAVAKELSNKPEFAKKSVQDRLLRIRQMSQPDVVSSPSSSGDGESTPNNNNIVDEIINMNNDNLNATLLIKDANIDEQNDSIKNIETIVACN